MAEHPGTVFEPDESERGELASKRWAITVGVFYRDLADRLIAGAKAGFAEGGVEEGSIEVFEVPGAFELPLAARQCVTADRFAGVACLGVVIRGETDHYDFVCAEAARGIQNVQLTTGLPCSFGVITCDTREQAEARTGGDKRDQGRNAAIAVMRMHLLGVELGPKKGETGFR